MTSRAAARPGTAIAPVLAGVVLGAALQLQQPALSPLGSYRSGVLLALVLLALAGRSPRGLTRTLGLLVASTLLSASLTGWRAVAYAETALAPALEGRDVLVTGVVDTMPHRNEAGLRFRFEPESARLGDEAVTVPSDFLLGWYVTEPHGEADVSAQQALPDLRPGERWQFAVRLKAPHGNVNPHGFDYELWLWEQGVQATGYVRSGRRDPPARRLASTWSRPVERARHAVRDAIYAQVSDPRLAGVIAALVVGDQAAIERTDWDIFRATGVAHLMSISGLHITMFAWAAGALVGFLWRRSMRLCLAWPAQHAARIGGVLLATAYSVFSGWGVPSQRTVLMLAVVAALRLGAREWPWPWVWLLACATVVAVDPWALTQAGFWLSFLAVGVLFASGPPHAPAPRGEHRGWLQRLRAALMGMLREQGIVTLALTPLTLLLFNQISIVGLLANLLAIPWVTLVVTPLGLAGVLFAPAWRLAGLAVDGLALFLGFLAALPFATWSAPAPPLWAAAAGMSGGLLLAMRLPLGARALGVPLMLPVLLWQAPRPPPGAFELLAADIGQGNAVLVRTAHHALVYDTGPGYSRESDAGQRVLVPLLRALDERLDLVVLSHRDSDHTGGAAAVLAMQPQARLLSSLEARHPLQAVRHSERCAAGQSWEWDGVRFEILHPQAADYEHPTRSNALSCVLRIASAQARVLLAGDIEKAQEAGLATTPERVRADVLLVPHHGSRTSSTAAFLDAVRPAVALVQAGYRNRFGHPALDVMARYRERGIAVTASPACGAAAWDSRAPALVRCERRSAPHYWHHLAAGDYKPGASQARGPPLLWPGTCYPVSRRKAHPCRNSTRCSPWSRTTAHCSSRASPWAGCRRSRCRASATTTAPMRNGWAGNRRR